jgi:sugar phosphate isomerase/epimerase
LNLALQWWAIPGGEMNEKLDFLEANGFAAVEIPSDDWPIKNCDAMIEAMKGRKLFLATACGPSDFSYAEPAKREAEVQKFLPIIEALGKLNRDVANRER